MRLKSLVLSGFKSFPKRTIIHFSKGVSAVVGPNGSGKSNIVDAIRWVLGEQNPRLLRAEKMEELIFSGSIEHPVDAARVKLSLTECQDMAPPELKDFPDIEIERVLFRDGTSKFMLNGKNCRLKEIRYLFLDTGAGARAYSIIDQGRVGQFVTMTPDERRAIVEEAAGIARYRERRIQALARLKSALENLERLEDVISEVKRQRNALKRQARKAERFLELRRQEERLGLLILKNKFQSLVSEKKVLRARLEEKEAERSGLASALDKVGLKITGLDLELEELFSRQKEKRKEAESLKAEIDGLSMEVSGLEKDLALVCQKKDSVRNELHRLKARINGLKERISQEKARIEEEKHRLSKLSREACAIKEEVERQGFVIDELKAKREKIKDEFVVVASRRAQIHERLSSARSKRDFLEDRLERMDEKRKKLLEERRLLKAQLESVNKEFSALNNKISEVETALHKKKEELFAASEDLSRIQRKQDECRASISEKETSLSVLKRLEAEGTGLLEGTKVLRQRLNSKHKMVAEFLEVEEGFEGLVETALGITLQSLVFKEGKELAEAIDVILSDKKGIGKASFMFAEEFFETRAVFSKQTGPDNDKVRLSDKILSRDLVSRRIRAVLSNWLVVESMARFLSGNEGELSGLDPFFVISPEGFVLTPWKEVRYVGRGGVEKSGLLFRKKQIRSLSKEVKELQLKEKAICESWERLISIQRFLKKEMEVLESEQAELDAKKRSLQNRLNSLKPGLEGVEDRLELLDFESDETSGELHDLVPLIDRLNRELEEAKRDEVRLKERLKSLEDALCQKELENKDLFEKRNRIFLDEQGLKGKIKVGEAEIGRLEQALRRADSSILENQKALERLEREKTSLSKALFLKRQGLQEKRELLEKVLRRARDLDETIDLVREKRVVLDKQKTDIQKELSKVSQDLNRLRMDLAENEKNREHLAEMCASQYRKEIETVLKDAQLEAPIDVSAVKEKLIEVSRKLESFGPVNLMAVEEFGQLHDRLQFLLGQRDDVFKSVKDIEGAIDKIDKECRQKLKSSLQAINRSLGEVFPLLFEGGRALLCLVDEKNALESGIEYRLKLPGKKIGSLSLLSGGEKALCALALIFAIFLIKPTPFCLLDEVDAPLDESNTGKFNNLVGRISSSSQVILVTHNQRVMEMAETLYGVTMEEEGISKLVSVKMV